MSSYKDYKKRALQNPEVKSEYDALNLNLIKVRKPLIKASVTSYLPYQKGVYFKTYSGLPFTYEIRKGRNGQYTKELWIDRHTWRSEGKNEMNLHQINDCIKNQWPAHYVADPLVFLWHKIIPDRISYTIRRSF